MARNTRNKSVMVVMKSSSGRVWMAVLKSRWVTCYWGRDTERSTRHARRFLLDTREDARELFYELMEHFESRGYNTVAA